MSIFLMIAVIMAAGSITSSSVPEGSVVSSESEQEFIEAVAPIVKEIFKEYGGFSSVTLI